LKIEEFTPKDNDIIEKLAKNLFFIN
jgi:hypothetical protein